MNILFYTFSILLLFVLFCIMKKIDKKTSLIPMMIITFLCTLVYQVLICWILTIFNISINLTNLGVFNLLFSILVSFIIKKNGIQSYFINKSDIVISFIFIILISFIVYQNIGKLDSIRYYTTDASIHYIAAKEFYQNDQMLYKTDGTETFKQMMPIAYVNVGILFKVFEPIIGEINLYKIFIIFDMFILTMSGILIYLILKRMADSDLKYILAISISVLYVIGYPLNSMLSGYSYLSVGIVIVSAILLFMNSFEKDDIKNIVSIIALFLFCMQVFFSYYLFVPMVYGALGIYYIIHFRRKYKKIWNLNMVVFVIITLMIPAIIGFMYQILPEMNSITDIQTLENIKTEGYIYRNMITNFLLLIPFAIYYFYKEIKQKKLQFFTIFAVILIIYMLLIGLAMLKGMISTYYFYKLHFILWLTMWILFYKGAIQIIENIKIGDIIVKTYMIWYVGLLIVSLLTINVGVIKDTVTHEKITDVMDIYGINKTLLLKVGIDFTTDELEILKYINENDIQMQNNNTLILANQRQEFWFWAIEKYKFKENLNYATQYKEIKAWNEGKYEYLVYFNRSEYYKLYEKFLELEGREVIFENESGAIIKNK